MEPVPPASDAELLRRQASAALRQLTRPAAYLGLAREAVVGAGHVARYPLGLGPARRRGERAPASLPQTALLSTDMDAACMPVILVHGWFHNRSAFIALSRRLRRSGFRTVHTFNHNPLTRDIGELAALLGAEVDRVLAETGSERCSIVGHSLGGLVARSYVQDLGGEDTVDTVITLGTPHRGTYTSYLGLGRSAAQLRPGSAFLRRLDDSARPSAVRWIAYYSDLDVMVAPARSAKLTVPALQAENVRMRDTGHLSLLVSGEVLRGVTEQLLQSGRTAPAAADAPAPRGTAAATGG